MTENHRTDGSTGHDTGDGTGSSTDTGTGTSTDTAADEIRVDVLHDDCVGAGQCVLSAPEVFDQDNDGIVVLLREDLDGLGRADREGVEEAVRLCPSGALRLLARTAPATAAD
ncbi:ferredoxin [Kitasatospora purpeofusca]|uniref:ferredoxin n=1 Tax=Kitasatospora purpeofusca TaxID=67352 RepID=UPI003D47273D